MIRTAVKLGSIGVLAGCASVPPIKLASESRSAFDSAVYKGDSATVASPTPGLRTYRVFNQGSSGFVPIASVRSDAEQRATEFCERKGGAMNPLSEIAATPPFVLGNFPRVEIVFECAPRPPAAPAVPANPGAKYTQIADIKKLLDSGALTQEEFDREKAKILATP